MRSFSFIASLLLLSACAEPFGNGSFYAMNANMDALRGGGLACATLSPIVGPSNSALVKFSGARAQLIYSVSYDPSTNDPDAPGMFVPVEGQIDQLNYTAPSSVTVATTVRVQASTADNSQHAQCEIRQQPAGSLALVDDGRTNGLVGKVYAFPWQVGAIPDYSQMTPTLQIVVGNLNVPDHDFSEGFPGVPNLVEWFGIRFDGVLTAPASGNYSFMLASDDGSILYIDGQPIVNDDGTHGVQNAYGSTYLSAGNHTIRVDYYEGPRVRIALQLFWITPAGGNYAIVPTSAFSRAP